MWELIQSQDIAEELEGTYMQNREDVPQCMQGIVWMDQECTTRQKFRKTMVAMRLSLQSTSTHPVSSGGMGAVGASLLGVILGRLAWQVSTILSVIIMM